MEKEIITDKEGICLLTIFIMGSAIILGTGSRVKNDAWLAGAIGLVMSLPMILIYARIHTLFLGKDLFEICVHVWGGFFGRAASAIYIFYSFFLGALVLRDFGEFINTVALIETPLIIILLSICMVAIAAARGGIEVMARISKFVLPVILAVLTVMQFMSLPILEFDFIMPVIAEGWGPVLSASFSVFSFPFAESVVFMGVFYTIGRKKSITKVFLFGLIFGGVVIIIQTLFNILTLSNGIDNYYFPSYVAASRIRIGDFLQRVEGTIAISFLFTAFIKISICLFVACKGIARVFNLEHYKFIVIQTGLLMTWLAVILFDNIVEMNFFAFVTYALFALPFQVVIPIVLWISAEIKHRKSMKEE